MKLANSSRMRTLFSLHAKEMMEALKEEGVDFSIVCEISMIAFFPELNYSLREKLGEISAFILSGYSLASLRFEEAVFEFEAGLMSEGRGEQVSTIVRIPYIAVLQIYLEDEALRQRTVLYCNPYEPAESEGIRASMLAILSKNGHLIGER